MFSGFIGFSQTYALDPTFGTNGTKITNNDINPSIGFFENGKYHLFGNGTRFARYNYDGSIDYNFGNFGFTVIGYSGELTTINSAKMNNGYMYGFGKTELPPALPNGFIVRLMPNGTIDTSFGNGGRVLLDLGLREDIEDIVFNPDGSFLVIGTQTAQNTGSPRLFAAKFTANGLIDTSFNGTGAKIYNPGESVYSAAIFSYGNGYLLGARAYNSAQSSSDILLIKIDSSGNIMNDFGIDGTLRIQLNDFGSSNFHSLKLVDNKIYCHYYWGLSFNVQGNRLRSYDLANPAAPLFTIGLNSDGYFSVLDSGKIMTARGVGCVVPSCYSTSLTLNRYNPDGTADMTFATNGIYNYDFYPGSTIEGASFFYIHDDDRIFIAGNTSQPGLMMLRIGDINLGNPEYDPHNFSIYPNPTNGLLSIGNSANKTIEHIAVSDISGKTIAIKTDNPATIDVSQLQQGIYFLNITSEGKSYRLKFIRS